MRANILALTTLLFVTTPAVAQQSATGTIRYVTDGDTFRLASGERIRIAGIDAPETDPRQAKCRLEVTRGKAAKAVLAGLIEARSVRFTRVGRSYNRTVATVSVGGRDLAASLIAAGAAKPWPRGRPKPDWCRP
jgi:micrococcal nuclease